MTKFVRGMLSCTLLATVVFCLWFSSNAGGTITTAAGGEVGRVAGTLQAPTKPCQTRPENREFNFWVGEWDVKPTSAGNGPSVGTSKIESLADNCIILENWESTGFSGKSWNFYDLGTHKWRQIWLDVSGRKAEFSGEYKDGAMKFEGETITGKGQRVKSHMTFFNLGPNKVRQFAERSTDDGKTWTTVVDFIYLRKK
jgi:hypothetical protein